MRISKIGGVLAHFWVLKLLLVSRTCKKLLKRLASPTIFLAQKKASSPPKKVGLKALCFIPPYVDVTKNHSDKKTPTMFRHSEVVMEAGNLTGGKARLAPGVVDQKWRVLGRGLFDPWIFPSIWNEIKHIPPTEREGDKEHHGLKKVRATPATWDICFLVPKEGIWVSYHFFGGGGNMLFFFLQKWWLLISESRGFFPRRPVPMLNH